MIYEIKSFAKVSKENSGKRVTIIEGPSSRDIFLTGLIILMQNEVDKPTRLLRFTALAHLPFSFRSLDLFVASFLFMKGTSYCVVTRRK